MESYLRYILMVYEQSFLDSYDKSTWVKQL